MQLLPEDPKFPIQLKSITDPPKMLHYLGCCTPEIFRSCVAFVGTRNITPYGYNVITNFIRELSNYDCTIVSGFSRGVDIAVHEACLKNDVSTIAILPCGLNYAVKLQSPDLISKITQKKGLVISEYLDDFEPKKWSFIRRNRLIAGISSAIVIVEAAEQSGSLITAGYAQDYGRKVYVVPGNIFSPYSAGIYKLLFSYGSAVISGLQIANLLKLTVKEGEMSENTEPLTNVEDAILNLLKINSLNSGDISQIIGLSTSRTAKILMSLSLRSKVKITEGKYYAV